jgi:hypothetical protein
MDCIRAPDQTDAGVVFIGRLGVCAWRILRRTIANGESLYPAIVWANMKSQ